MLLADGMNPKTPPRERAQVARAWKDLEEQKRIIKMKPAPKAVDADKYKEHQKKRRNYGEQMLEVIDESTAPAGLPGD
jgi:DNA-binding transcriptional regulator YhcF (GntR family)